MGSEHQKRVALLIFALSPDAELQQKSIAGERELFTRLNRHTITLAKGLGIPYFLFTEKEQEGDTFGERYTHAIKKIFSLGYDGIITIGNDTPGLTNNHLKKAFKCLLSEEAVLGPSLDGGFYLLAIPRNSFSEEAFLSVSWNSHRVFRQMYSFLNKNQAKLNILNVLGDLDTHSDIITLIDQYINIPFGIKKVLLNAQRLITIVAGGFIHYSSIYTNTQILNRGSPLLTV